MGLRVVGICTGERFVGRKTKLVMGCGNFICGREARTDWGWCGGWGYVRAENGLIGCSLVYEAPLN
jgi:hypothetical protein